MNEEGGGISEEDVLQQQRQRLMRALVLKWPTLLAIPPRQVGPRVSIAPASQAPLLACARTPICTAPRQLAGSA